MTIRIEPWAIALILLIVSNILFSYSTRPLFRRLFMTISSALATGGLVGTLFAVRVMLEEALAKRTYFEPEFIDKVLRQYNLFAKWSCMFTAVTVLLLLWLLVGKRHKSSAEFRAGITVCSVGAMFVLLTANVYYSFGTFNKDFNTAAYLGYLAICECLVLYVPLIAKRIMFAHRPMAGKP